MSVYVDGQRASLGRMKMCHMVADTLDELHAMAALIGMKREWFQESPPASTPHYDVSLSRRKLAVEAGAVEVDRYGLVEVMRRNRGGSVSGDVCGAFDNWLSSLRNKISYCDRQKGHPIFGATCAVACKDCQGRGWYVGECHPQEKCVTCDGTGGQSLYP